VGSRGGYKPFVITLSRAPLPSFASCLHFDTVLSAYIICSVSAVSMLATARVSASTPSGLDQDMAHSHDSNGQPREGYLNLTRRMENEYEDQFDVDLTILDFLVYKAIELVFEWKTSRDPYHSDLPNALVNMTAGMFSV
jgi:hypothetical protein